jgi:hypothetical protein
MNPPPHARERVERQSLWRIFRWPLVLGFLSAVGLVSALLGDGIWDALSWLALSVPVTVVAWFAWRYKT